MRLTCSCGAVNRLPNVPNKRMRCGKCQHVFAPAELVRAEHEAPPEPELIGDDDGVACVNCGQALEEDGRCGMCDDEDVDE